MNVARRAVPLVLLGALGLAACSPSSDSSSHAANPDASALDAGADAALETAPEAAAKDAASTDYAPDDGPTAPGSNVVAVASSQALLSALANAKPGDEITLEDGSYDLGANVWLDTPGTATQRIFVRSRHPLGAHLRLCNSDGFQLWNAAFWIFEDLWVEGVCHADSDESNAHAFHIMYRSNNVILRHNQVVNFKSHVKLNAGQTDSQSPWEWPDDAWFIDNTFQDTQPIGGLVPHNALNIDGGDRHVIRHNAFVDLVTSIPEQRDASGIYVKMTSRDFLVEQNLLVCTRHVNFTGDRRGIYSGDELGPNQYCDGDCANRRGLYRNNIVLGCKGTGNATGIDVGNEKDVVYAHNTLHDVKSNFMHDYPGTTASIVSNILYASFVFEDGVQPSVMEHNLVQGASGSAVLWKNASAGDFTLLDGSAVRQQVSRRADAPYDFCGHARAAKTDIGAIDYGHPQAAQCVKSIKDWFDRL